MYAFFYYQPGHSQASPQMYSVYGSAALWVVHLAAAAVGATVATSVFTPAVSQETCTVETVGLAKRRYSLFSRSHSRKRAHLGGNFSSAAATAALPEEGNHHHGPSRSSFFSSAEAVHVNRTWRPARSRHTDTSEDCAKLTNQGTHFTVSLDVGTPSQSFDVVADTGSSAVIVPSCICQESGHCSSKDSCFRGTNRSSSFHISDPPSSVVVTFGSGSIEALVATDTVHVGRVGSLMEGGVLLMVDRALDVQGPFEGILGLGLPLPMPKFVLNKPRVAKSHHAKRSAENDEDLEVFSAMGFLQSAGVKSFSICFNDGASGVLRLGPEPGPTTLPAIGQIHWGLDFRGLSVGKTSGQALFCNPSSMKHKQESPCGAIPDSGTTLMMAPAEHLLTLFDALCDKWRRCHEEFNEHPSDKPKHIVFQLLLLECREWLTDSHGLNELPNVHLHFAGDDDAEPVISLRGVDYILETMQDEVHYVTKHLFGIFPIRIPVPTGEKKKVCAPAFGVMNYTTTVNGPVWILGTPLFYKYEVVYDLHAKPPTISFKRGSCGDCSTMSLISQTERVGPASTANASKDMPREIHGPIRLPSIDVNLPL